MRCPVCDVYTPERRLICRFCGKRREPVALAEPRERLLDEGGILIGRYRLFRVDGQELIEGQTPKRRWLVGMAGTRYELVGPGGVHLLLGDVEWPNGERCVQVLRRYADSHVRFDQLVGRVRLPFEKQPDGTWLMFLRQARYNGHPRVTLASASSDQLAEGAGLPVLEILIRQFGATVGFLDENARPGGRKRSILAASFHHAGAGPLAAFVLTRVAPTARAYDGRPESVL